MLSIQTVKLVWPGFNITREEKKCMNGRITTARGTYVSSVNQGRPVNVKHDARCVMGKVGGRQKPQRGEF